MMTEPARPVERVRLRWGWILVCALLGVTLLAVAAYGEDQQWGEVVTGTLVNVGSALLFSFVLFFFENRFTKRVVSTVQRVTDAAEQRIAAQTAVVTTKLDDIEARMASGDAARRAAATSAVDAVEEEVSAERIEKALAASREEGVISAEGITVPGYDGATDLTVTFSEQSKRYSGVTGPVIVYKGLHVQVGIDRRFREVGTPVIEADWTTTMDAVQLANVLGAQLRQSDRHAEARNLDWPYVFRMLARALHLANTVTGPHATLGGKVYELAAEDWLITSAGIEQVSTGRRIDYTDAVPITPTVRPRPFEEEVEPPAPEGIDNTTWALLRKRAAFHKPRYY